MNIKYICELEVKGGQKSIGLVAPRPSRDGSQGALDSFVRPLGFNVYLDSEYSDRDIEGGGLDIVVKRNGFVVIERGEGHMSSPSRESPFFSFHEVVKYIVSAQTEIAIHLSSKADSSSSEKPIGSGEGFQNYKSLRRKHEAIVLGKLDKYQSSYLSALRCWFIDWYGKRYARA